MYVIQHNARKTPCLPNSVFLKFRWGNNVVALNLGRKPNFWA